MSPASGRAISRYLKSYTETRIQGDSGGGSKPESDLTHEFIPTEGSSIFYMLGAFIGRYSWTEISIVYMILAFIGCFIRKKGQQQIDAQ